MKSTQIRWLVVLGAISITGVLLVQVFWLKKAYDLRQNQFNSNVQVALKNVVESLCQYNGSDVPDVNPIEQVSGNYFVVRTNDVIPPNSLEYFLKAELQKRSVNSDFEYSIYDCSNQNIVFSEYIDINREEIESEDTKLPPRFEENEYYFGVYFPHKTASIANQMAVWIFSSVALLIVVVLFAFALFIIFRQKRLSEIQRDFVNNMAHEFNTPISTIRLASDYISKENSLQAPEKVLNYASIIQRENSRLKSHVDRVLQIAKPERSDIKLEVGPCDIDSLLKEAKDHVILAHQDKPIEVTLPELKDEVWVKADKMHLYNVIYNLFDNSVKYCSEAPKIEIQLARLSKSVTLEIKDNGTGIPKKFQKRIFDRFFRVPKGEMHDVKGFGIGLFYVKVILKKMKASIKLSYSNESGTSFMLKLPTYE